MLFFCFQGLSRVPGALESVMRRKNTGKDTDFQQEKRYQFIREQVRPQKKVQAVLFLKRFGILAVTALIFGVVSGGGFVFIQNNFLKGGEEVVQVHTVTPTPAPAETSAPPENKGKDSGKKGITLNDVNRISRQLSAVGKNMDSAMVGIKRKEDSKPWPEQAEEAPSMAYGLIFGESVKYFDILTTCETVQKQPSVRVQLMDDTMIEGEILGSNAQLNVAVVRIKKEDIGVGLLGQITVAKFGSGFGLSAGTNLIAVGCPNGILHSVVTGMITNETIYAPIMDGEVQVFCTSIPYSETGNGVVLDVEGRVVGIITTAFTKEAGTTGMAFVKITNVTALLEMLQKKMTIPYIGIEGRSISEDVAKAHNLVEGAYVTEVYAGTPAYEGGMRVADVITQINGESITGMADIYNNLIKHKPKDKVVYTVHRKSGNRKVAKQIKVVLG